jgi:hypothetical protein
LTTWRVSTTTVDNVWIPGGERVSVYRNNILVKEYSPWWGSYLARALAHFYVWRHRVFG